MPAAPAACESSIAAHDKDATYIDLEPDVAEPDWKEVLLDRLLHMPPDAFERLAQRLPREAGFRNVEVLGKSGDGGALRELADAAA